MDSLDFRRVDTERVSFEQFLELGTAGSSKFKNVEFVPPSMDFDLADNADFGHVVVTYKMPHYAFR